MSFEGDRVNLRVKMTDLEWTHKQVIQLVNEYKSRPELWDSHHDLFRVQSAKYEAYCQLAEIFQCDVPDLKKKLNSIFASHRREIAKIRTGARSTWFLYPSLSFMPNHIENIGEGEEGTQRPKKLKQKHHVSDNDEIEEEADGESEHSFDDNDGEVAEEIIIKEEPISVVYTPTPKVNYTTHKPRLRRVLKRKLVKDSRRENTSATSLLNTMKLLKKSDSLLKRSDSLRKKDECDSFGEYIAISLRKHDDRTQSMIKQAINNILFEQEMKRYNNTQYTVVVADMEENPLLVQEPDTKLNIS